MEVRLNFTLASRPPATRQIELVSPRSKFTFHCKNLANDGTERLKFQENSSHGDIIVHQGADE